MKASKSTNIKRKRLRKGAVVDEENEKVVEVGGGDHEIDYNVAAATEKKEERSSR